MEQTMIVKLTCMSLLSAMTFSLAVSVPILSSVDVASAKTYTKREHVNRDKCYRVKKVPALVEYNTRGIKVRGSSRSWSGNMGRHGSVVRDKYHPEVYIQTRRVLEDEHTTLVPTSCR